MNIEEAKQVIYNMEINENNAVCKNCVLSNREHCVENGEDCQMEAIYTILNELDKKDKVIEKMAEDKYDNISMTEMSIIVKETGTSPRIFVDGISDEDARKIIIEYFDKKVEG